MAGEAMTLLDYADTQRENFLTAGFINAMLDDDTPGGGMGLLAIMPIMGMDALNAVIPRLTNEGTPTPTTRPIGGTYNSGVVTVQQEQVGVGIFGQDVLLDRAFLKKTGNYINGLAPEEIQTKMLAARMNRVVNNYLMNGNKATDPNGFNGIRYFVDSQQVINANADITNFGSYTNGLLVWNAPSTTKNSDFLTGLDYCLDAVGASGGPTDVKVGISTDKQPTKTTTKGGSGSKFYIVCNNQFDRCIQMAVRGVTGSAGTFYSVDTDLYERRVTTYRGVPIICPGAKNPVKTLKDAISNTNAILPNNLSYGSAVNACEAFVIRVGADNGCVMLEYDSLDVRTVADEVTQGPAKLIRADWYPGFYRFKESAIVKYAGVVAV